MRICVGKKILQMEHFNQGLSVRKSTRLYFFLRKKVVFFLSLQKEKEEKKTVTWEEEQMWF